MCAVSGGIAMKRLFALMAVFLLMIGPLSPVRAETAETAETGGQGRKENEPPSGEAVGYVRVTAGLQTGWLPVPEKGEYSYPLEQILTDGTRTLNVVHVSSEGVYMESSTCENQDCVEQGIVTFDNLNSRILGRFIICLPNYVTLELFTTEETAAILAAEQEQ